MSPHGPPPEGGRPGLSLPPSGGEVLGGGGKGRYIPPWTSPRRGAARAFPSPLGGGGGGGGGAGGGGGKGKKPPPSTPPPGGGGPGFPFPPQGGRYRGDGVKVDKPF